MHYSCPECNTQNELEEISVGTFLDCPECGMTVMVTEIDGDTANVKVVENDK